MREAKSEAREEKWEANDRQEMTREVRVRARGQRPAVPRRVRASVVGSRDSGVASRQVEKSGVGSGRGRLTRRSHRERVAEEAEGSVGDRASWPASHRPSGDLVADR